MEKYVKVGGWLKFFCVVLTVFSPLRCIFELVTSFQVLSRLWDQFPRLKTLVVGDGSMSIGLMAFSIYTGVALWQIRPRAVVVAKYFLLSYLGYAFVAGLMPFGVGFPDHFQGQLIQEVLLREAQVLVFFTVWFLYLSRSKRVKNTYPVTTLRDRHQAPAPATESPFPPSESLPGATV
ncbi:MAG: DUF2569 family protein [Deltaproteobacteria bacterium]|nr:DUF2569 family protein [Deltaproteobacteria bacterium]